MKNSFLVYKEMPKKFFDLIPQKGVTHLLCEEFPRHNAVWDMAIRDDGRVFFSVCAENFFSGYARLYEYDHKNKRLIHHFNLEDQIIEREMTLRTSKFHTALSFMEDGRIITTTHTTSPAPNHYCWMPYQYANHQWEGYAGSNIIIYDPETKKAEGRGIISPFDTTYGGTYCPKTGDYFCITWMRGTGYVYNVHTGEVRCLGQVSDTSTSRTFLCSDGHIYGSTYSGKMFRYNSDTRDVEYLNAEIGGLMRHARERDGILYIITGPCGSPTRSQSLIAYDMKTNEVRDLGRLVPDYPKIDEKNKSFYSAYGMDFDSEGRLWYSCMMFGVVDDVAFEWGARLYMWDIFNGKAPVDVGFIGSEKRSVVVTAEFNIHNDVIYISDGNHSNVDDLYCGILAIDLKEFVPEIERGERIPSGDYINYMLFPASCAKYYPKDDLDARIEEYYEKRYIRAAEWREFGRRNPYYMPCSEKIAVSYWEKIGRENTRVSKIEWSSAEKLSIFCGVEKHYKIDFNIKTGDMIISEAESTLANELKADISYDVSLPFMAGRQFLAVPNASVALSDNSVIVGTKDMMLARVKDGRVMSLGAVTPCGSVNSLVNIGDTVYGIAGHECGVTNMFKYDSEGGVTQLGYVPTGDAVCGRRVCIFNATTMAASPDGKYLAVGGADELSGVMIIKP